MNRRELLDRFSADEEQRLLLGRCLDKMEEARRRNVPAATAFLSPAEQAALAPLIAACGGGGHLLLGGYAGAQRKICLFLPDWLTPELAEPSDHLAALRAGWYRAEQVTHRDILGAVMGLGVKRETVGDILVSDGHCDIIALPQVARYLLENLTSAGRSHLKTAPIALAEITPPEQAVKLVRDSVSALRLDSVLAAGFSLSRAAAQDLIRAGKAAVNWRECQKPDAPLREGDEISCRGLGKCRLKEVGGLSRKGRTQIVIERFL